MHQDEQLHVLKTWWEKHGTFMMLVIIVSVAVSMFWYYRQQWYRSHIIKASALYEELVEELSHQADHYPLLNPEKIEKATKRLIIDYADTPYASLATLVEARIAVEKNALNEALSKLRWAEKNVQDPALKQLIRLRMARVLFAMQHTSQAFAALDRVNLPAFSPVVKATRGAMLAALGQNAPAQKLYKDALTTISTHAPIHYLLKAHYASAVSNS